MDIFSFDQAEAAVHFVFSLLDTFLYMWNTISLKAIFTQYHGRYSCINPFNFVCCFLLQFLLSLLKKHQSFIVQHGTFVSPEGRQSRSWVWVTGVSLSTGLPRVTRRLYLNELLTFCPGFLHSIRYGQHFEEAAGRLMICDLCAENIAVSVVR